MVQLIHTYFNPPALRKVQEKELYEAQRELGNAQTQLEYAAAMVTYNKARVARLQQDLMGKQNVAP